ncbi:MAG TPA: hypothetical protein VHU80_03795 [Polyangiaceae bacterium]|jgi:hypothetical protein|nr:hypothetical protein [Polyangiaceae bacterium]
MAQAVDLCATMAEDATVSTEPNPAPTREQASAPATIPSEAEINSPDKKSLIALFVVFAVTTASWGAARFACNMHPPESHAAPKLSTDRLLLTAKDAAIEYVQRWRSMDYEGALATVSGEPLTTELTKAKADCAAKANECARQREASAGRLTSAVVLAQDGFVADTRVTTVLKGTKEVYRVRVRRDGPLWKAVSKSSE